MTIAVLVMTDGRDDYLEQTVRSAMANLSGPITEWWMNDDSGDFQHQRAVERRWPTFQHMHSRHRQGFGGAIRAAWSTIRDASDAEYVFHLEGDFTFRRPVNLGLLAGVLSARPYLVQMALMRQPCNDDERAAGGLVERYPDAYTPTTDGTHAWLEHRLFYTTNPSVVRRTLVDRGWPAVDRSEGRFGIGLLTEGSPEVPAEQVRFGYWGNRTDGPWVDHIGTVRAGTGY